MNKKKSNPEDLAAVPRPSWEKCRETIEGYLDGRRAFAALKTSVEIRLFDVTAEPTDAEGIAMKLGTDAALTGLLCSSLAEMGFLEERDGVFRNTDRAGHYFVSTSPHCQADGILASAKRVSRWDDLTKRVVDGPEIVKQEEYLGEEWVSSIATGAKGGSVGRVIAYLEEQGCVPDEGVFIDIGGGHGLYAIGLCARHPRLKGRVFDRSRILPVAKRCCEEYGVSLELLPGDLYENAVPGGNDLAYASFNPAGSDPDLAPNVAAAVNDGGTLVVRRHTKAVTKGALRNLERSLKTWEDNAGEKRRSSASSDRGELYIDALAKEGVRLLKRETFDGTSEMLVFRKTG